MKKLFFILMGMTLCLAATAAPQRLQGKLKSAGNRVDLSKLKKHDFLIQQMSAPVMSGDKSVLPLNECFTRRGVTPDDNPLMKKAPRRLSAQDLLSTKVVFKECFDYDYYTGEVVRAACYYDGGWDVEMEQMDYGLYGAYIDFLSVPANIYVDFNTKTAEMVMDCMGGWQWADSTVSGRTKTVNDTTMYLFMVDEAYMLGQNDEMTDISGTVYSDGSLYFPDGWCYVMIDYVTKTVTNYNGVTNTTRDTVMTMSPFYRNTYLMTPNATHDYDLEYTVGGRTYVDHYTDNAYMFQFDDSTAVAWNLWGCGGRGVYMNIHEDGTMVFPAFQLAGTVDMTPYEEAYPEFDWSEGYENVIVGYDESNDSYYYSDIMGTVSPEAITWGGIQLWNYCTLDGVYYAVRTYPLVNNELRFVDGESFLLGTSPCPEISVEVFDEYVLVAAVPQGEGGSAYLFDSNGRMVENPYTVNRTEEDQHLMFFAVESDPGKNMSELIAEDVLVPGLSSTAVVIGDVNGDSAINLQDVVILIDRLLSGDLDDSDNFIGDNADIDQNNVINLDDVVALMNMVTRTK